MGSRVRKNPERIFEMFCEVARPDDINNKEPFILQSYPSDVSVELQKSVPKFAFPCNFENPAVDHFTFTFTDIDSNYTFGFCRHTAGAHTCLCIISFLPWYEIFYKLLNKIAEILNKSEDNNPIALLSSLYKYPVPEPGDDVNAISSDYNSDFSFTCPDLAKLPSIPGNRNLTEYYNAVDVNNMMIIFASMLYERRILITSKKLSRMTACVHGCASLIYPMHWQHLYIPVLPSSLIDYVSAPMPFLIGIHSTLLEKARKMELGDVVILDADKNTVETEYDDLGTLPSDIVSSLKRKLKQQQSDKVHTTMLSGDGVARAFLRTLVNLIGGYRDALKFREGDDITFDEEAFLNTRPSSVRPFLEEMLKLQIFHQFIEERLALLNAGEGFSDVFEEETTVMADKGSSSKYKEWMGNMKKHGKKFKREGKDMLSGISMKANPVIRSTFETVKDKSKKAMKDLKSKIEELRKDDEAGPSTLPSVPLTTERPPRPPPPGGRSVTMRPHSGPRRRTSSYEKARHYKPIEFDDMPTTNSDDEVMIGEFKHTSVGLLDDPDIQNALHKSWSYEDILTINDSDEEGLLNAATENASMLPVPVPRQFMRKNMSDTALNERQHMTQETISPVAPPRKKHVRNNDAPLITLSSIAPDISDSDSDSSSQEGGSQGFGYQQVQDEAKPKEVSNLLAGNSGMSTLERNKVRALSQRFNQDITKHVVEQTTGKFVEPRQRVQPVKVKAELVDNESKTDTIERNKVKNLSQRFHQDITKHITEQQTGKIYEPAYRGSEAKPRIARHEAFRDSNHPVPMRRSVKVKKTDVLKQQLIGQGHGNTAAPSQSSDMLQNSLQGDSSINYDSDNADKKQHREASYFEDSFVPSPPSLAIDEQNAEDRPELSPNTNLLQEWDLKFDLTPTNQTIPTADLLTVGSDLTTQRPISPQNENGLKIHVRGPYGRAGYAASPTFMEVTTYANQSNYVSTPIVQPQIVQQTGAGNVVVSSSQTASWSQQRTSPNYSAIYTTDLMSPGVFGKLETSPGKMNQNQRQNFLGTQSVQQSRPYSAAVIKPGGFYTNSAPNSSVSFGQVSGQAGHVGIVQPQSGNSVVLQPQSSASTGSSNLFADLDPLKSMVPTKTPPKWETFQ